MTRASGTHINVAARTIAGLQKWAYDTTPGCWKLAYTLKAGLGLGQP